ncbi:response regulator transcription factor [Aggregicoccus sp. 17bor-14]|uniref:response regulator n=1 Tax=Myxococcaceae TaxID=31 RepID=UPI00129C29A3|nr:MULTISPECIES: response regulator transcription factor [Myxococcaceae]MBF5045936.1 response regulator transcription factor [Simulacricoccus sp. 17bor-14]MRI91668.1 response regulator transcription factor [Aggregicoccus sp. 17bor-14]
MSLLVVEDELRVRAFIARGLGEEGFLVRECADGAEADALLRAERFELVLLDWMLPGLPGLELLKAMRARQDVTPVVMLTARDAVADRVAALNAGADDYLVKPFAFEELLARVRAVTRRASQRVTTRLSYADLVLDPVSRKVLRAGVELSLTAREFSLLQFLLEHAGEVVSRTRIVQAVWEHDFETFSNVVEVYIRYLRAKVDEPFGARLIHTVRGVGYVLRSAP